MVFAATHRAKIKMDPGLRRDDEPLGLRRDDEPLGLRRDDEPLGLRRDEEPLGLRRGDERLGFRRDDERLSLRGDDERLGFRRDDGLGAISYSRQRDFRPGGRPTRGGICGSRTAFGRSSVSASSSSVESATSSAFEIRSR